MVTNLHVLSVAIHELSNTQFKQTFLELSANRTVEENWCELKQHINKIINDKVPHKWYSTRYILSWFNRELTRMTKCKQRLYNKAKQTQSRADWDMYNNARGTRPQRYVKRTMSIHVEQKLIRGLEEGSTKPFWRYIKSLRRDNSGISPLKQDGKLHNDPKDKAEILNNQFKSVFTQPPATEIP